MDEDERGGAGKDLMGGFDGLNGRSGLDGLGEWVGLVCG